jgi:phosphopantothenoylcysteine synthetase/decarboxylase
LHGHSLIAGSADCNALLSLAAATAAVVFLLLSPCCWTSYTFSRTVIEAARLPAAAATAANAVVVSQRTAVAMGSCPVSPDVLYTLCSLAPAPQLHAAEQQAQQQHHAAAQQVAGKQHTAHCCKQLPAAPMTHTHAHAASKLDVQSASEDAVMTKQGSCWHVNGSRLLLKVCLMRTAPNPIETALACLQFACITQLRL